MCAMSFACRLSYSPGLLVVLVQLLLIWCEFSGANPVQQTPAVQPSSRPRFNQTCITENLENGTLIISSNMVSSSQDPSQQTPTAQFNERRRDMFFEDYNIKQIEVIDTSVTTTNRSASSQNVTKTPPNLLSLNTSTESSILGANSSVEVVLQPNEVSNGANVSNYLPLLIQPQRPNVLMPKLEQGTGRPSCVQSPDDTFCEIADNYPNKTSIKNEIDYSPEQFNDIFGSKEIDGRKSYVDTEADEEAVCRKVPRVIYPQMAKNQANQWVYVVNEVEYTQAVVAEICEKPGKPCSHLENMPMGMYSRCKQKYSYKRLLALHPTEKRTYPDAFKFPSCCSCYIKYLDDYLGRSNSRKVDINETGQGRDSRAMSPVNGSSAVVVESQPSDNSSISTIEILSSNPVEGTTIAASSNSTVTSNTAKGELAVSQATVPQK